LLPVGKGHAACGLRAVFAAGGAAGFAGAGAAGAAGAFFAEAFFAGAFFAAAFFAGAFFAAAFLAGAFFTADFFAAGFFAAAFFAVAITFLLDQVAKAPADSGKALTDRLFTARRSGHCRYGSGAPGAMNQVANRVRRFCVGTSSVRGS
jgi:hypothetical protein